MPIENRRLEPGTKLVAKYKGKAHTAEVIAAKDGAVRYRLADGREFASPSAAGKAVMGGVACNGWRFWSVAGAGAKPSDGPEPGPSRPTSPDAARTAPGGPDGPRDAEGRRQRADRAHVGEAYRGPEGQRQQAGHAGHGQGDRPQDGPQSPQTDGQGSQALNPFPGRHPRAGACGRLLAFARRTRHDGDIVLVTTKPVTSKGSRR